MKSYENKRTAEGQFYKGLAQRKDVRVEFLTIGCAKATGIDLMTSFDKLRTQLKGRYPIEFCGVLVDWGLTVHAHILWQKLYIRMKDLRELWQMISHTEGGVKNQTIVKNKARRGDMKYLVDYLMAQDVKHVDATVSYFESPYWVVENECEGCFKTRGTQTTFTTRRDILLGIVPDGTGNSDVEAQ